MIIFLYLCQKINIIVERELITILESGHLYKFKDYYHKKYTYFCPSRKRNLDNLTWWNDYGTMVSTVFKITIYGKFLKASDAYVRRGYVKKLKLSEYIKVNNILRKYGYVYNKVKHKLVKIEI